MQLKLIMRFTLAIDLIIDTIRVGRGLSDGKTDEVDQKLLKITNAVESLRSYIKDSGLL